MIIRPFAFILLLLSLSSWATAQTMSIVIDSNLNELATKKCFNRWIEDLENKGYLIFYHSLKKNEQTLERYKSIIRSDSPTTLFLLGDLAIPKMDLIQRDKTDRTKNKIVNTESLFPLYSTRDFPKLGKDSDKTYFKSIDISIGVLNLIYHRAPNYSSNGIISQYCDYFNKVTKYKNCEQKDELKTGSMVDLDFNQLDDDIFHLDRGAKKYKALDDLIQENQLDFSFLAAHANSKKIYFGKGEKQQTLTINSLLKKKISTRFFNLYSCRILEDNGKYSIGKAFFGKHSETLGLLGSAKSGALAYPQIYFDLLKKGYNFGDALRRYIKYYAVTYGGSDSYFDNNGYHSGLIFYGDPTLDLHACKELE